MISLIRENPGFGSGFVIIPFGAFETAYVVSGPDSLSFDPGISGDWIVSANFDNETLADGLEYVNDGESIVINMHTDAVEGSEDFNIVGVRVTLQYWKMSPALDSGALYQVPLTLIQIL